VARPPRAEAVSDRISIRFSPAERWRVAVAARLNRQNLSTFVRMAAETAAADSLEPEDERFVRMRTMK
jgi:uncharacterized protein (DUF1778 family)